MPNSPSCESVLREVVFGLLSVAPRNGAIQHTAMPAPPSTPALAGCQLRHHCNPEYAAERSTISGDAGPNAGQFSMMSTFVQVLEHTEQNAGQFSMMSTFALKHTSIPVEQHVESTKHAFQYKTCTLAPS